MTRQEKRGFLADAVTGVRMSYCLSVCFERAQITRTFNSKKRTHHLSGFTFDSAQFVLEAFFIERISTQYVFDPASIKPFIAAHLLRSRSLNASVL